MKKWPDGTPKSMNNAFTVVGKPTVMTKDKSHINAANANAKKGATERSRTNLHLSSNKS